VQHREHRVKGVAKKLGANIVKKGADSRHGATRACGYYHCA
jgi:hypothetical protein